MDDPTAAQVTDGIKQGDYDGDLVAILEAVRMRFAHGTTEQKWKVTHAGEDITQDSLTLAEASFVEKQCGTSWASINPSASAAECQAIVAVRLARDGMSVGEALESAGAISLADATDAVGTYEVMRAPKGLAA